MEGLKVRIENYVVSNKDDLKERYLFKVLLEFGVELLELHEKRDNYDTIINYILSLKYKYIS